MGYLERIIGQHTGSERSSAESLTSLLLRRGFLVWTDHGYVYIHEGSTKRDIACCAKIADELNIEFDLSAGVNGAFVLQGKCKFSVKKIARVIFTQANRGNGGFAGMALENEVAFFKTAFGTKAETVNLDPGVALLVKTIPRIACRTWMSCDGHHLVQKELAESAKHGTTRVHHRGNSPKDGVGKIWFAYDLDRAWFEYASEHIVNHLRLGNFFSRHHPDGSYAESSELFIATQDFPAETYEESCFLRDNYLHRIARALMDDELVATIRSARPRDLLEAQRLFQGREGSCSRLVA